MSSPNTTPAAKGTIGFIIDGVMRASHVEAGASPAQLGQEIVAFIRNCSATDAEIMALRVEKVTWVDRNGVVPHKLDKYYSFLCYKEEMGIPTQHYGNCTWKTVLCFINGTSASLNAVQGGDLHHLISAGPLQLNFRDWGYYIDFENRKLQVWRTHDCLHTVGFDELEELGTSYMNRILKMCDTELREFGANEYFVFGTTGPWMRHAGDTTRNRN